VRRYPVKGRITLGGQPLKGGSVVFLPNPGNPGSASGTEVLDGQYYLPRERGLSPGSYKVLISSLPSVPKKEAGPPTTPPAKERIPPRYNIESELTVEVQAESENTFDFPLKE
jgi:hypothetical protein